MLIPDDLVREVLRKLPVKSLMRFKCVSRIWLSIIRDPFFTKAYPRGSPSLLSCEVSWKHLWHKTCLFYVGLDGGTTNQILAHHMVEHGDKKGYTDLVDGLLCFYRGNDSWLYNVATREMVQLPVSTDKAHEVEDCRYHFGFDPINERYKLLKTCSGYVEILTIGVDSAWRIVDSLPPEKIRSRSACFGVVLCWMDYYRPDPGPFMAFHLAEEKFLNIPTPVEEDQSRPSMKLMNFGPNIAVTKDVEFTEENTIQILRYCPDGNDSETGGMWVEELTLDPYLLDAYLLPAAIGILPNGKMLVYDRAHFFGASLSCFDRSNNELEEIEIHMPSTSRELLRGHFDSREEDLYQNWCYYEENIISLRSLISCI